MNIETAVAELQYKAVIKIYKNVDKSILNEIIDNQRIFQMMMDDVYLKPTCVSLDDWYCLPIETRNLFLVKGFKPSDSDIILGLSIFSAIAGKLVWSLIQRVGEEKLKHIKNYSNEISPEQVIFNFWALTKKQKAFVLD